MGAFSRIFRSLQTALPPSGPLRHELGELLETISPVMLVPGQAANADRFFPFMITAAPGVTVVNTSRVTSELWTPYIQFEGFHNDPVARHLRLILVGTSAGGVELGLTLQSSETDYPGVPIGTNIAYTLRRLIWVPPNFFLRVQCPALAALQTVSLAGATAQINLAEPSPPLFA